jgi:hypothetical protein
MTILQNLKTKLMNLKIFLINNKNENENIFHKFLYDNPILLDVYGNVVSKPRLYYPKNESPLGKKYVEPDFIIKYPQNKYKLVELEKPSKQVATKQGQPRSEVSQAVFQIAEWQTFIYKHYNSIKDDYPDISNPKNCTSMVVISTKDNDNFQNYNKQEYINIIKNQYACDDIFVYDDLLEIAKKTYEKLCFTL